MDKRITVKFNGGREGSFISSQQYPGDWGGLEMAAG
jgi:hypothetical protein